MNEISFLTVFKAVCKKWLLIGFCAIIAMLAACVYAFTAVKVSNYLFKLEIAVLAAAEKDASPNQNLNATLSYFTGERYKKAIYSAVSADISGKKQDPAAKEINFYERLVITHSSGRIDIYAIDFPQSEAQLILDAASDLAEEWIVNLAGLSLGGTASVDIVIGEMIDAFNMDVTVPGFIRTKSRTSVLIFVTAGGVAVGVAIALALYFFNNRFNSVNSLECAGIKVIGVQKSGAKAQSADHDFYTETALKIKYLLLNSAQDDQNAAQNQPENDQKTAQKTHENSAKNAQKTQKIALFFMGGNEDDAQKTAQSLAYLSTLGLEALPLIGLEAVPQAADSDGIVLCIRQRADKAIDIKRIKGVLDTANANILGAFVTDTAWDFVM